MSHDDKFKTRQSLLEALRDPRNHIAWQQFLEQYRPLIEKWCRARYYLQQADIDDIAQEVFKALVPVMPKFQYDPDKSFRAYLRTVTNNAANDKLRAKDRRPGDYAVGGSDALDAIAQVADDSLGELLGTAISNDLDWETNPILCDVQQRVKPHVWQAFYLTVHDKMDAKEVAAQLGIKQTFVYVYKARVKQMLMEEQARRNPAAQKTAPVC
ncbi:MAG: sigma-70 family RNA polymerase sigma factor [Planctomycetes bacterium]|nr:sigma-70 family RNA polymerase sigma factor [Planctomycetota bacterium]